MTVRLFVMILVTSSLPASVSGGARIDPHNPPQGRFSDEWAEVFMNKAKIGYSHSTMAREGDLIRTSLTMLLELGRVGQPVSIGLSQTTTETLGGIPIEFGSKQDMAVMTVAMKGKIKDDKVFITQSQFGMDQELTFDFPKGALMSWGLFRESLLRGFAAGTKYDLKVYEPGIRMDDAITASTSVGEIETFELYGKTLKGRRVVVVMVSPLGTMEMISWVDDAGQPVRSQVPMPGLGHLEILSTDQKTAMADFVPAEMFVTTLVQANRSIDKRAANRVKYRVRPKDDQVEIGDFPSYAGQSATANADGSVDIVVTRVTHEPVGSTSGNKPMPDMAEYLDGNLMINIADPQLAAIAKEAARGEKEPFALGDNLRRFVTEYIDSKNLNIGFATASEVCRNKEGDCSEHGVLLAALGRICKLPSRVAVGVVYLRSFGGKTDVFGYHMWTQFHIDNRWIDFDAALRETQCNPTRIAFATSSLKNTGLADLSLPLISKIGAIDIEIVEVSENDASD